MKTAKNNLSTIICFVLIISGAALVFAGFILKALNISSLDTEMYLVEFGILSMILSTFRLLMTNNN